MGCERLNTHNQYFCSTDNRFKSRYKALRLRVTMQPHYENQKT